MTARVVSRVAGLGALTAAGQLLIVCSLPAYSRIFDPSTYGEYVIFVGIYTVVSVLAGVRYDSAIVIPRSHALAASLSALVVLLGVAVSALIALLTPFTATLRFADGSWAAIGSHFGYGLAVATMVGTLQRCLTAWCIRSGRFLLMGCGQFLFCLIQVVAQLSLARVLGEFPALVWGYVCALACQAACLASHAWRPPKSAWTLKGLFRGMKLVARKYRRFPAYMVGYALASSVRDRLIQAVLGLGAGAAVVGRFGLAYRVVFAPNSLVYSAVSPVFFAIASRGEKLSVGRFAAGLVEAAFVFLVVPYTAFAIEAPTLTDQLLSEKWQGTGPYLQALAGPALLLAATCWLDRAFDSFRRQRVAFLLEFSFTLIAAISVGVLSRFLDPVVVVWVFGALALAYYWIYFLTTFLACGFPLADFRRACATGAFALLLALVLGDLTHQITSLILRALAYAFVMAAAIAGWIKFRGGAAILRTLFQSRISSHST